MIRLARARTAVAALLLGATLALPLAQGAAPQSAHAAGGPQPYQAAFLGTWHNADPNTRGITVIRITYDAFWHSDKIEVWARCSPEDCSWGHSYLAFNGPTYAYGSFYLNVEHGVDVQGSGANLQVTDDVSPYPWQGGRSYSLHYTFLPGA